jgi:hypothetical protein
MGLSHQEWYSPKSHVEFISCRWSKEQSWLGSIKICILFEFVSKYKVVEYRLFEKWPIFNINSMQWYRTWMWTIKICYFVTLNQISMPSYSYTDICLREQIASLSMQITLGRTHITKLGIFFVNMYSNHIKDNHLLCLKLWYQKNVESR